jgi:pimeloyl-ACP methyl ester carboxylesterase
MDKQQLNGYHAAPAEIQIEEISANGWTFYCRRIGDFEQKEVVIFLHGWPESSHMWEGLMQKLYQKGFSGLAIDQRGFSPKARPEKISAYKIKYLIEDVIAIADACGIEKFHLIGHDWGAAIGWGLIASFPERIKSFVAMSVPHIKAFGEALKQDPKQYKRSAYMRLFQWPWIPEWRLSFRNYKLLHEKCWMHSKADQIRDYMRVLGNRAGLRASLNYYRANYKDLIRGRTDLSLEKLATPTLMIWGKEDPAVLRIGVENTAQYMTGPYRLIELDAGHWLIQEEEAKVTAVVIQHLKKYS